MAQKQFIFDGGFVSDADSHVEGNLTVANTITAGTFAGDGSGLTGKVGFFAQSAAPTYAEGARDGDLWRDIDDGTIYMATETGTTVAWFAI